MPLIFNDDDELGKYVWVIISFFITLIVWESSRRIVAFLWEKFPWERKPVLHLLINAIFLFVISLILIFVVYFINYYFTDYKSDYWQATRGVNVAMVLITFFTTTIYEALYLFRKWKDSLIVSAMLEKENIRSQFEALKNQVNPHFLFNNLSTLASIITIDPEKAVEFVGKFSKIYRYVLDVGDENIIELKYELEFVMAYFFLQKTRFDEKLKLKVDIEKDALEKHVLPLSIQMLIENAIKHNEISDKYLLEISITNNNEYLIIKNNLQLITDDSNSTKTGLKNLANRYKLISDLNPEFYIEDDKFVAKIPFLNTE